MRIGVVHCETALAIVSRPATLKVTELELVLRTDRQSDACRCEMVSMHRVHSWKLTWKPKKGPIKTLVLLNGDYMGFHVNLGECKAPSC